MNIIHRPPARINGIAPPAWPDAEDEDADPDGSFSDVAQYLDQAPPPEGPPEPAPAPGPTWPREYTLSELRAAYPSMRPPIIDGMLRRGETLNVIASPKTGKSWLAAGLAFAVADGRDWLGYPTTQGKVLLLDNELHPETLVDRLDRIADAHGIDRDAVSGRMTIVPLRGQLTDLDALGPYFRSKSPGQYSLVIIDAWYRSLPAGTDENDNGAVAGLYNLIDQYAAHLGAAFALIHHASKGAQSDKRVTDIGSGAGSQSRAADTHLVLREHWEPGVFVMDAVTRSFAPIEPRCLRWQWPRFHPAPDLDPADLRNARRRKESDAAPHAIAWTAEQFACAVGTLEPRTRASILDDARTLRLSGRRAEALLREAIAGGHLYAWRTGGASTPQMISTMRPG